MVGKNQSKFIRLLQKSKEKGDWRRIIRMDSSDECEEDAEDGEGKKIRVSLNDLIVEKVVSVNMIIDENDDDGPKDMVACVKFKYCNTPELIPIEIARKKCPQLLIKYYESRIYWRENGILIKNI